MTDSIHLASIVVVIGGGGNGGGSGSLVSWRLTIVQDVLTSILVTH